MGCGRPHVARANGLALQLHSWGDAARPPALLLHSLAAHAHWWDWTAPALATRHHVVALDFRGHGGSAWADRYTFDDYVADVGGVLDALGWRAPLVVGHSMGGYVAALLAARHPDRVDALVMIDVLTGWTEEMARRAGAQADRSATAVAAARDGGARFRLTPPETTAPPEWLAHLGESGLAERRPGAWEPAFDRRVFLHPPPDPWPFLPNVTAPTLVIRGAGSAVMSREAADRVAATVQRGTAIEIANAFHHVVLDAPDEVAVEIVQRLS